MHPPKVDLPIEVAQCKPAAHHCRQATSCARWLVAYTAGRPQEDMTLRPGWMAMYCPWFKHAREHRATPPTTTRTHETPRGLA